MRLLHVTVDGADVPAVMLGDTIHDASGWCAAWAGEEFSPARLAALKHAVSQFPVVDGYDRIGPCVKTPGQILAVGLNYRDHAQESNMKVPSEPVCFTKSVHSLSGPNDDIILPAGARKLDWEVEVGLVIGELTYQASVEQAGTAIAGYFLANDVSEREWQLEREGQWSKGKSAPTFCPIGPWVVPASDLPDASDLQLTLSVNGRMRQSARTSSMIFDYAQIVSRLSSYMELHPGDIILTGTPDGVGLATGEYLAAGDEVVLAADGLGEQRALVVDQIR